MLGRTNVSAGSLCNLKILTYPSLDDLPEEAKEGVMALITAVDVNRIYIRNAEPEDPEQGDVWISLSATASDSVLNLTRDGSIQVNPGAVQQYIDGEWVVKEFRIRGEESWGASEMVLIADGVIKAAGDMAFAGYGTLTKTAKTDDVEGHVDILSSMSGSLTLNSSFTNAFSTLHFDGYASLSNPGFNEYSCVDLIDAASGDVLATTGALGTSRSVTDLDISEHKGKQVKVKWAVYGSTSYGVACNGYCYKLYLS